MPIRPSTCLAMLAVALATNLGFAQSELQKALNDLEIAPHWIYDDLPAAWAQAKETGKPLLVVLRCVPCPPGRTLDSQAMKPGPELEQLEKNFVCVRVVQANSLDLKRFQYDFDMSWAAMMFNADGTIYGRYGTRTTSGPNSDTHLSVASFRKALQRALELHKEYPGNQSQLAGKLGPDPEYAVPVKIPGLQDKPAAATARQNCIHCHMVKEHQLRAKWLEGRLSKSDLFVYPMPERVGITLDIDDGLLVKSVEPGSPAAKAGLSRGDVLRRLNGQPLVSTADVQWVLHRASNEASLPVVAERGDRTVEGTIVLSGDWKEADIGWRASSWYGLRQGLKLEPLPAAERESRGLGREQLALVVKGMFGAGGPKLQKAGLRNGDIIVGVDDKTQAMTESEFLVHLRLTHGPEDSVKLSLLRGGERKELSVPLW